VDLYTRRQLTLLLVIVLVAGAGIAIDRWRRAHPELVERLEALDRAPTPAPRGAAAATRALDRAIAASADPASTLAMAAAPARIAARSAGGAAAPAGEAARAAAGPARPAGGSSAEKRRARGGPATPLDVNRATRNHLERLPGIGPGLAGRIVEVREQHGAFASIDELRRVRGIGRATLDRVRPLLVVGPAS
jgi:competence ComEA-like helix-hairpin-helix protein